MLAAQLGQGAAAGHCGTEVPADGGVDAGSGAAGSGPACGSAAGCAPVGDGAAPRDPGASAVGTLQADRASHARA